MILKIFDSLGDLGTLRVSFSSEGVNATEEVTVNQQDLGVHDYIR